MKASLCEIQHRRAPCLRVVKIDRANERLQNLANFVRVPGARGFHHAFGELAFYIAVHFGVTTLARFFWN